MMGRWLRPHLPHTLLSTFGLSFVVTCTLLVSVRLLLFLTLLRHVCRVFITLAWSTWTACLRPQRGCLWSWRSCTETCCR